MKKRFFLSILVAISLLLTFTSCEWFNTEEPHECENACSECGKCLDIECQEEACVDKCSCHIKETLCPECGGCVYTGCKEAICMKKCSCERFVNVDEELVAALSNHLKHIDAEYDLVYSNTERKIDHIKHGIAQPLMVTFDSINTYYVAVYFLGEHHNDPSYPLESGGYCCIDHYVWVRFDNAEEITRTYNSRNLLAAFVISETEAVSNILSEDAKPQKFVLFNMFDRFLFMEDEIEVPDISSEPFIYLNYDMEADTVYYDVSEYSNYIITLPCVKTDETYYIIFRFITISGDNITADFGKYYDELMAVVNPEIYKITDKYGNILECYLIEVEDFVKILKEE